MIPIFIITCDRLKVLKQAIQSYYDNIKTPFEIVIIDFGSTYEPTREFLRHLEYEGKKVYWREKLIHHSDFNCIDGIIRNHFENRSKNDYIVTDPDIALDNVEGDVLNIYSYLLETLPDIGVAGPMLKIDDIPDYYPKKEGMIEWEMQFHLGKANTIQHEDKTIRYMLAPIDTTFGMYREGTSWKPLNHGIRVLPPYSAKHLDWYLDPDDLSPDQKYYMEHASKEIIHWSF